MSGHPPAVGCTTTGALASVSPFFHPGRNSFSVSGKSPSLGIIYSFPPVQQFLKSFVVKPFSISHSKHLKTQRVSIPLSRDITTKSQVCPLLPSVPPPFTPVSAQKVPCSASLLQASLPVSPAPAQWDPLSQAALSLPGSASPKQCGSSTFSQRPLPKASGQPGSPALNSSHQQACFSSHSNSALSPLSRKQLLSALPGCFWSLP